MFSSRQSRNRFWPLVTFLVVHSVIGGALDNENSRVELRDFSVTQLTDTYFKPFNADVSLLRITGSKIDKIHRDAFNRFKRLNMLDVSDGKVKGQIDPNTFTDLSALEILILRNVGIRDIMLKLTNVQELILSQNEIENFSKYAVEGPNVNYLDLSGNKIKLLEDSMGSMKKLSMIDLSRNKIEYIGDSVFANNTNLLRILASENRIRSTDGLRHPKLKTLDLFANKLTALPSNAFEKMSFLEDLVLAFNNIKDIDDPFVDLIELKYLNLAWNFIEEIRPDLFRNNFYLTQLSLQGNKLRSLNRFVNTHEHLVKLDVSHNELSFIDDEFFNSMPNLSILDLSFNNLKTLADILQPLEKLNVLNAAYNELMLTGYEFVLNKQLTQVNLSTNLLEIGLKQFENNTMLAVLDLGANVLTNFCDSNVGLRNLRKIFLSENQIADLNCLKEKKFESLCLLDLRRNPLSCSQSLDDLVLAMAIKKSSPFRGLIDFEGDVVQNQCEALTKNESLVRWNSVKRELCPQGLDVQLPESSGYDDADEDEDENDEDEEDDGDDDDDEDEDEDEEDEGDDDYSSSEESYAETIGESSLGVEMAGDAGEQKKNENNDKHFIVIPIGKLSKDSFTEDGKESQSERVSWEEISRNPELKTGYEDPENVQSHYNWYTIVLGLIGICLTLTCFNLLVFLYIRVRIWRRSEMNSPQKYTFLKNEVYKNTTEPTGLNTLWYPKDEKSRYKVFNYGKINEFFQNFAGPGKSKDHDSESIKNILIQPSGNPNV